MPCEKEVKRFAKAREIMGRHLAEDEGLAIAYVANVAHKMWVYGGYSRNQIAVKIINMLFDIEVNPKL